MKALSFRQPWAELVLQGRKTMDLRTWTTGYRGRIAIHVAREVEHEAALAHDLDPAGLAVGGVVGTVELVDVILLDEAAYAQHLDAHLAGRGFRPGMAGWLLAAPERLPEMIAVAGRRRLFEVDLAVAPQEAAAGHEIPTTAPRPVAYAADLNGTTPERPFALHVRHAPGATTDYTLTLRQRIAERPGAKPRLETVAVLGGDPLRAVADHVIEALRKADYKATDLSPARQKPFYLPEEAGVRLGLVFLAVKPLGKLRRVEQISHGIRRMPPEEAYYWYSKCTAADTAERARQALRVLLAAE
ncbi:MAG: ASCH domain-containing protein [Candidatus Promineofilum sp.]|nr:ASCH domain-containing protein [Promineifilum sp.]